MKKQISIIALLLMLMTMGYASFAFGAVSADEASKLGGPVLTPMGAEKAGNKDGSIPAWTGVPIPAPKGFKPGSGIYVDPFADEKPLFSINAKNMNQYSDKLAEGVKVMMKRYPDYRIDVYPSHRTMVFPQWFYDATKKNATVCEMGKDGLVLKGKGCHGGAPFPIPKTGLDLYWNHVLIFNAPESIAGDFESYNINSNGKVSLSSAGLYVGDFIWQDPTREDDWRSINWKIKSTGPARRFGEGMVVTYPVDYEKRAMTVWQYLPGQRRVRLAPDVCCDTPSSSTGGASTYDDSGIFTGNPERFTWKIIGKKEMYIPNNNYKFIYYRGDVNKSLLPHYINPDMVRWELQRVWVVEATLKPGKRHVYSKRIFYAFEDNWGFALGDHYDKHNALYRMTVAYQAYSYDVQAMFKDCLTYYDLIANAYAIYAWPRLPGGIQYLKFHPESFFSPDALAGTGLR